MCVVCRQQQGGGGGHDAGVVHAGEQEERAHPTTEPALSAVRLNVSLLHTNRHHTYSFNYLSWFWQDFFLNTRLIFCAVE